MDGLQSAGAGALNIFNQVVKEQNAMGRHADRIDHLPKRFGALVCATRYWTKRTLA
jgi:hypothetical protein